MKRLSIASVRGGDGKPTRCSTVPRQIFEIFQKTLLLADFDDQGSLRESYLSSEEHSYYFADTTFSALTTKVKPVPIQVKSRIDIIPASESLQGAAAVKISAAALANLFSRAKRDDFYRLDDVGTFKSRLSDLEAKL